MIQYFVNILPFEKRLSKFRELESEESELKIRIDDLASKFNLSNTITKSIYSGEILHKAERDREECLKDLGSIHKRLMEITSLKNRLLKSNGIQKAISEGSVTEVFRRTKDAFKRNVITMSVWKEAYKTLTNSKKVKYSDVVVWCNGKILLIERNTTGKGEEPKWCVPGGHVDPGEDFIQAAERELREETGIILPQGCELNIRGEYQGVDTYITYFELFLKDEPTLVLDNSEHKQLCWVDPRELGDYPMIFDMAENLKTIFGLEREAVVTKIEGDIEKGRKYFKREGSPGNYKYYYTEEEWKKSQKISEREKNPFHNKELKSKLAAKASQAVLEGRMDEYTKVVAADYGLTFKEAVDLLAEATEENKDE